MNRDNIETITLIKESNNKDNYGDIRDIIIMGDQNSDKNDQQLRL